MAIQKSTVVKLVVALVVVVIGGFVLYTWAALSWSFSKGERAGYVQKFSQKGWLCKTWEGELQMVPVPGATPEKFAFSVRDKSLAEKLNTTVGRRVTLEYEQHKGIPTSCFGETEYFIVGVKNIE